MYAGYIFLVATCLPEGRARPAASRPSASSEPNGARGVWQLGVLVLFSGLVAYYLMRRTDVRRGRRLRRADHVDRRRGVVPVLPSSTALFGAKRVTLTAAVTLAVRRGAWYLLKTQWLGEDWALLSAAFAAGALYALVGGADRAFDRLGLVSSHGRAGHLRDGARRLA